MHTYVHALICNFNTWGSDTLMAVHMYALDFMLHNSGVGLHFISLPCCLPSEQIKGNTGREEALRLLPVCVCV